MALPAGRRGIRADLVKSDGTISDLTKLKEDFAALSASDIPTIDVPLFKSLTGNPVTISDAVGENAKCAKATLEPIQSGSGTPSPTNVRPITGRTSVNVTRTGKNLCSNASDIHLLMNANGVMNENAKCDAYYFPTSLGTVTISIDDLMSVSDNTIRTGYVDEIPTVGTVGVRASNMSVNHKTYELDTDYKYFVVMLLWKNATAKSNVQVEIGSSATPYEEYTGQSVTVQLGQTVYGGTLDVTTGLLTVETANIASYNGESIGEPWWSSMDEYVAGTTPTTGAQVVYTLATPTTVSLTPAQIQLFIGTNIISTNADALSILYCATEEGNVEGALQYLFDKIEELSAQINE